MSNYTCKKCKAKLKANEAVIDMRDFERNEIISEEHNKTKVFKGLDLTDSTVGKANKALLKPRVEIASKESLRLKSYERGDL